MTAFLGILSFAHRLSRKHPCSTAVDDYTCGTRQSSPESFSSTYIPLQDNRFSLPSRRQRRTQIVDKTVTSLKKPHSSTHPEAKTILAKHDQRGENGMQSSLLILCRGWPRIRLTCSRARSDVTCRPKEMALKALGVYSKRAFVGKPVGA